MECPRLHLNFGLSIHACARIDVRSAEFQKKQTVIDDTTTPMENFALLKMRYVGSVGQQPCQIVSIVHSQMQPIDITKLFKSGETGKQYTFAVPENISTLPEFQHSNAPSSFQSTMLATPLNICGARPKVGASRRTSGRRHSCGPGIHSFGESSLSGSPASSF